VSSPNGAAPDTMSAGEAAPPASSSPAMEATSATSDDACKHDEDRLAKLQAKPSLDEAVRFESELRCPKVWPQLLAMLKVMSDPAYSDESSSVAASPLVADGPPYPTERTADAPGANLASDEVCKRDEERLARLRRSPSSDEAARFAEELSCEKLRPQLLALTGDLASPSPTDSWGVSKDAGAETNATNEAPPTSEAAADADHRIAALERERDALAAEVGRLEHHRDSTSPGHDEAPPAMLAKAAPTAPDDPTALSAERLGAAGNGDRAALSPNAAAPAPPSAAPDQNVDVAPPAILAKAAPTATDDPTALSAEQLGAAGNGDRAALSPNAAAPAPPSAAPDQNVDVAPLAILAKAAPTAPDGAAARVVAGLPKLAPVRVILNVARDDSGRARRSADIRQALAAAGLEVADHIPVDAQRPGPSIGYYFQSDRNAAAEVSHLLEPLLGAVDPVAIRKRGSIPEPGTIEIAIP
jgi:hypothetical protein